MSVRGFLSRPPSHSPPWPAHPPTLRSLDGISLKVSATNVVPRTWNPDPAYGGPSAGESPDWGPGWYKPLRITRGNFPHTLRVPVVVRSLHDPRSNFYRIMGGGHSLDFGSDGSGQIVAVGSLSC